MVGQIEHYAIRVHAAVDGITEFLAINVDIPCPHHLEGAEPIQMSEGDFTHQLIESVLRREPTGVYVAQMVKNFSSGFSFFVIFQVIHRCLGISNDFTVPLINTELAFQ